jgi:hypothetical protein
MNMNFISESIVFFCTCMIYLFIEFSRNLERGKKAYSTILVGTEEKNFNKAHESCLY